VLVTGPRQSGKTTFLRAETADRADYISFDDPLERDFAIQDPAGFLARFTERPVILDEIQYAPALLPWLKMRIDAEPRRCGRWLLTGSQQFHLMRDVGESLAGRVALLELPPFSRLEYPRPTLEAELWGGGYPVPSLYPERRDLWLRGYFSTYVERDVRQLRNIADLHAFSQFLALAASRHAQQFHPAHLARELGLSQPTIKSWGGVLEASYLAYLLRPWARNYGKRITRAPKLYFQDSALVAFLTRQPDAAGMLAGPMGGSFLEGWVVVEAMKAFMALGRSPDIYYWRSHDGLEVDLLVMIHGRLQPVEIKLTATPTPAHFKPLDRFLGIAGDEAHSSGVLVCRTESERRGPGGHLAIPWHRFPAWLQDSLSTPPDAGADK
jgi:hypothetical protein